MNKRVLNDRERLDLIRGFIESHRSGMIHEYVPTTHEERLSFINMMGMCDVIDAGIDGNPDKMIALIERVARELEAENRRAGKPAHGF